MVSRSGQPATVSQTSTRTVPSGRDLGVLDHAEVGDRPVDLRILDPVQRAHDLLGAGRRWVSGGGSCSCPHRMDAPVPGEPRPARPAPGRLVACRSMARAYRPRRSCLAVPGSTRRFIDKARGLPCDEVFLDLEDSVAPARQGRRPRDRDRGAHLGRLGRQAPRGPGQRRPHAVGLPGRDRGGRGGRGGPGRHRAAQGHRPGGRQLARPAAHPAGERTGPAGRAGSASRRRSRTPAGWPPWTRSPRPRRGWRRSSSARPTSWPAWACDRWQSEPSPPGTEGDAFHYPLLRILVAARSRGLHGHRRPVRADRRPGRAGAGGGQRRPRSATTGNGSCIPARSIPSTRPSRRPSDEYDRAELILEAYEYHTGTEQRGAAMLDGEMIDEATRKLALAAARERPRRGPAPHPPLPPAARRAR